MNEVKVINTEFALRQGAPSAPESTKAESIEPAQTIAKTTPTAEAKKEVEDGVERLEDAVASLNEYVQSVQRDLTFRLDDTSGKTVITVYDRNTEEVVRQMPDDVALRLARDLQQDEPISLFNAKV